ncbi:MAG: ATP synthase F1 subunit gamma [Clostridia bacterium]|nr:ATP synthase F1 subunit gamma [Clostridia bacterium]
MSADIKLLRTRLKSVNSTLHLTGAMGLVASSKIRSVTDKMQKAKAYSQALEEMVLPLTSSPECKKSPFLQKDTGKGTALIVIAGDRGLAGGYNANIFRLFKTLSPDRIFAIGKRACDRFDSPLFLAERFTYENALSMANEICREFSEGTYDKVGILSTEYQSMMAQEARVKWILPILPKEEKRGCTLFEPNEKTVLDALIPDYLAGVILSAVRESFASEIAARHVAMDAAEKNAKKMIDELKLQYNRARQGAITQEITEIVAGSGT